MSNIKPGNVRLVFDVPEELRRRIKLTAVNRGEPMRELVMRWIEEGLARDEKSKASRPGK